MRTHDDLSLTTQVHGRSDAALTVVLAHCWAGDHRDWAHQVSALRRELGDRVRSVTWDHRGHSCSGGSWGCCWSPPPRPTSTG